MIDRNTIDAAMKYVGKGQHTRQPQRDMRAQWWRQASQQLHGRTHSMACDL